MLGLQAEQVDYTYDLQGLLTESGGNADYLDSTTYSPEGQVLQEIFGPSGVQLARNYAYDAGTQRLLTATTSLQPLSSAADTSSYTYDDSGNLTSESDVQNTGGTQTQCFAYSSLDQLTTAWTDTGGTATTGTTSGGGQSVLGIGGCRNAAPAAANIGGAAPYWESWTYDPLGDRTSQTIYDTSLPASQDTLANATTQELAYPGGSLAGSPASNATTTAQAQPDAATSIVTSGPDGTTTTTPAYNADGQTTSLASTSAGSSPPPGPPGLTNVTYNVLGQVATAKTAAGTSSYVYDASGDLIGEDGPAQDTVFVDGGAEQLTETVATGKTSGVRFVSSQGGTLTAVSSPVTGSSDTVSYEVTSQQGTAVEDISAAADAVTRRYFDPYGNPVGTVPVSWPDHDAYLGKPQDPSTLLDLLGARQYDAVTGSFLSLDPVFEAGSPLQMGGYAYAAGNPVTNSDPTGLRLPGPGPCGINQPNCGPGATNPGPGSGSPAPGPSCPSYEPGCPGFTGGGAPPGGETPVGPGYAALVQPTPPTPRLAGLAGSGSAGCYDGAGSRYDSGTCTGASTGPPGGPGHGFGLGGLILAGLGLTLINGLQGGLDPATDTLEGLDIGAIAADAGTTAGEDAGADAGAGEDAAGSCGGQSFTAGTRVLLATGAAVPIASLKTGDKVLATNTRTGKTQAETVAAVLVHHDTNRYDLTVKNGGQAAVIDTTRTHLFWNPATRQWVQAAALKHGAELRTPGGSTATIVGGLTSRAASGWMWDLTVTTDHDFYIDTTAATVLVHNCDPFENTQYTQKVQQQMKLGDYHSFPELVKNEVTPGGVSVETGDDGQPYTHVRIPGTFGSNEGVFHWIIDDEGMINHRMFEPY
jgi:RHS repeat-associated protein